MMNKRETLMLMDAVQSYYPNFDVTDERVDAWTRVLADVEYRTVYRSLVDYVSNEEKTIPPSVARLKRNSKKSDAWSYMVLDQHRNVVIWKPSEDAKAVEIPVLYYRGTFIDSDGNEYAYPDMDDAYWEARSKVSRVAVPKRDENGNIVMNGEKTVMVYKYVPKGKEKEFTEALNNIAFDVDTF